MTHFTARASNWKREPFSFRKVCAAIEIWVGLTALFGLAVLLAPRRLIWLLPIWLLFMLLFKLAIERGLWKLLSPNLRNQIPYDRAEAEAGKGTVRSYSDLFRAAWPRGVKASP